MGTWPLCLTIRIQGEPPVEMLLRKGVIIRGAMITGCSALIFGDGSAPGGRRGARKKRGSATGFSWEGGVQAEGARGQHPRSGEQ